MASGLWITSVFLVPLALGIGSWMRREIAISREQPKPIDRTSGAISITMPGARTIRPSKT